MASGSDDLQLHRALTSHSKERQTPAQVLTFVHSDFRGADQPAIRKSTAEIDENTPNQTGY